MDDLLKTAMELLDNSNYKTVGTGEYPEIPDGDYRVNIDKVDLKQSTKGTDYINITVTIVDGDYTNQKMFVPYYFSEKTIKSSYAKLMSLIASCGYEPSAEMFQDFETLRDGLETLVDKAVNCEKKTKGEYVNYTLKGDVE